jgi:hypothetical protein
MRERGFAVRVDAAGNAIGSIGRGLPGHPAFAATAGPPDG